MNKNLNSFLFQEARDQEKVHIAKLLNLNTIFIIYLLATSLNLKKKPGHELLKNT